MKSILKDSLIRRCSFLAVWAFLTSILSASLPLRENGTGDISYVEVSSGSVDEVATIYDPVGRTATSGFECSASIEIGCIYGIETNAYVSWSVGVAEYGFNGATLGSDTEEPINDYYFYDTDILFPGDDDPDATVSVEYTLPVGQQWVTYVGNIVVGASGNSYPYGSGEVDYEFPAEVLYVY